jgi:S-DNA-T family DNA segregation ATPase FtsK/SpoIIIE
MDNYTLPSTDLLAKGKRQTLNSKEQKATISSINTFLAAIGIDASFVKYRSGPMYYEYDYLLSAGTRLSSVTSCADDIAMHLGKEAVSISPVPNEPMTVGISVPKATPDFLTLRDIMDSKEFKDSSYMTCALGKDCDGNNVLLNLDKIPHLLVCGTTGSGKSVCLHTIILSLLFKASPEEVKLILIDPKRVEFTAYSGIPHLTIPVVTDVNKATGTLQWAAVEMMKRYGLMAESGERDIDAFNLHRRQLGEVGIPKLVIVIDEYAEMMKTSQKECEEYLCRIAQMGRAAGIHLIAATQRPSSDVITGLVKANLANRIALHTVSRQESRNILDANGAETLNGCGDMLLSIRGKSLLHLQGAFVSDKEIDDVVGFIKSQRCVSNLNAIYNELEEAVNDAKKAETSQEIYGDYDELLPQAVDVIFDTRQASVSMIQRRLKLGYSRAVRLIDQMEELGIVGPFEGSKPRKILITREQWEEMKAKLTEDTAKEEPRRPSAGPEECTQRGAPDIGGRPDSHQPNKANTEKAPADRTAHVHSGLDDNLAAAKSKNVSRGVGCLIELAVYIVSLIAICFAYVICGVKEPSNLLSMMAVFLPVVISLLFIKLKKINIAKGRNKLKK